MNAISSGLRAGGNCFTRRRALVRLAGGVSLAAAVAGQRRPFAAAERHAERDADAADKNGFIDAHVHVWTDDVVRYPLAAGFKKESMKPARFTPADLLAHARPQGVTRIVLIQMSFYGFDNRYMLDAMRAHPGVFSGVAVIDPANRPGETMKELKRQGIRGFRIVSDGKRVEGALEDSWLGGPGMAEMWRTAARENLAMCCLVNPDALPSIDAMCAEHPDTPVVIDHFARLGMKGPIKESDLANLCRLARHKNVSVKISAFYALGKKQAPYDDLKPMLRRLVETFGSARLMWATDCPFQVEGKHTYAASIALVRDRCDFLTAEDKANLLAKTAERVFF